MRFGCQIFRGFDYVMVGGEGGFRGVSLPPSFYVFSHLPTSASCMKVGDRDTSSTSIHSDPFEHTNAPLWTCHVSVDSEKKRLKSYIYSRGSSEGCMTYGDAILRKVIARKCGRQLLSFFRFRLPPPFSSLNSLDSRVTKPPVKLTPLLVVLHTVQCSM